MSKRSDRERLLALLQDWDHTGRASILDEIKKLDAEEILRGVRLPSGSKPPKGWQQAFAGKKLGDVTYEMIEAATADDDRKITKTFRTSSGQTQTVEVDSYLFEKYEELSQKRVADASAKGKVSILDKILKAHQILLTSAQHLVEPGQSMRSFLAEWSITPDLFMAVSAIYEGHADAPK